MPNPGNDKKLQLLRVTRSAFIHPSSLTRLTLSKMKNSTLLRLFLICLGIPLTRASSSTPKPKTSALILSGTTNSASIIQLKEHSANVKAQGSVSGMLNKSQNGENRPDGVAAQPNAVQKIVDKVTIPLSTKRQPLEDIVDHSGLSSIDPYDDNPDTKYYLDLGCGYLAQNHSKKYENESVQEKQNNVYYTNCLHAVWPGSSFETLPPNEYHLKNFSPFKKGDVLTHPGKQPPCVAHEDGFALSLTTDYSLILYYHKDKLPMNLDVLSRLQWPHSRNLLSFKTLVLKHFLLSCGRSNQTNLMPSSNLTRSMRRAYIC